MICVWLPLGVLPAPAEAEPRAIIRDLRFLRPAELLCAADPPKPPGQLNCLTKWIWSCPRG
jgi:hypothetical protein